MDEELCLVDSGTTNSILRETKYFQNLTKKQGNVLTIAGRDAMIVGTGRATIVVVPLLYSLWVPILQLRMHFCIPIQSVPY